MPKVAAAVDTLFAEVRASIENAHALGMYDPVTSLPNRLHFRSEADKMLGDSADGTMSAMLFVDLDRFKTVNDSLGHARGDQLLIMVANRLRVVVNAEFSGNSAAAAAAGPARRRRVHHVLARGVVDRGGRAGRAARGAGDFGAVRTVLAQRRHRRLDRGRHRPRPWHERRIADARGGHRDVLRQVARRRAALPVQRRARRRAPGQARNRESAYRSGPARRFRARLPAADEPGDRRNGRHRGAAALEPPARRPAPSKQLHPDRRADRGHRRDRRMGDGRGRGAARQLAPRRLFRPDVVQHQPAPGRAPRLFRQAAPDVRRCRGPAVDDRARIHRNRGDGGQRRRSWPRSPPFATTARASRSTISAPATRISRGCGRCRSTGSRSTSR